MTQFPNEEVLTREPLLDPQEWDSHNVAYQQLECEGYISLNKCINKIDGDVYYVVGIYWFGQRYEEFFETQVEGTKAYSLACKTWEFAGRRFI